MRFVRRIAADMNGLTIRVTAKVLRSHGTGLGRISFQRKDGDTDGDGSDFRGQQRKNDRHASKTDPTRGCIASRTAPNRGSRIWATS